MLIRPEIPADNAAIFALTTEAFTPMPFSDGTEPAIANALCNVGDLTLSLVAKDAGQVIGHAAFSPVQIGGVHSGWFGLGPISVTPVRQKRGIGSAMVAEGISRLRYIGVCDIALIGNPKVYGPMGFKAQGLTYRDLPGELVQSLPIAGQTPPGALTFAPALEA